MPNLLHNLFGSHVADPAANHWDRGHFASSCVVCGKAMEKLPGLDWKLSPKGAARGAS